MMLFSWGMNKPQKNKSDPPKSAIEFIFGIRKLSLIGIRELSLRTEIMATARFRISRAISSCGTATKICEYFFVA